jgi:hypothetical protein
LETGVHVLTRDFPTKIFPPPRGPTCSPLRAATRTPRFTISAP